MILRDPFGRAIDYLRISLTDRCNFRCQYCYPAAGLRLIPGSRLLTLEEILRTARVGVSLGVRKIKLTGGEPLLFHDVVPLVRELSDCPGLQDLAITTNGSRLPGLAKRLYEAGLRRLNLSLDSLDPVRFERISGGRGNLSTVLEGFRKARQLGFAIKLNTVIIRDVNDDEVEDFIRFATEERIEVRFIEFMPLCGETWSNRAFVGTQEMLERLRATYSLTPLEPSGVARRFVTDTGVHVGFISSMSAPVCHDCRRLRLTAWGTLRPCLFSTREVDVRPLLRAHASDAELRSAFLRAVSAKPPGNPVLSGAEPASELHIRSIGG